MVIQTELEIARQRIAELEHNQELNLKIKQAMFERFTRAEAELARRDAAAGEPVAWQFLGDSGQWFSIHDPDEATKYGYKVRGLFPATQPSALPPEMTRDVSNYDVVDHGFISGYNQAIADAKALGCKAIKLPEFDGYKPHVVKELQAAFIQAVTRQGLTVEGE